MYERFANKKVHRIKWSEILLEKIINNWKKVYGAILGFIVGLTVINYGYYAIILYFNSLEGRGGKVSGVEELLNKWE